jgi:hypothetical protein
MRRVQVINKLVEFAQKYNLTLEIDGVVRDGRECVGFKQKGKYIGINSKTLRGQYALEYDDRLEPPVNVPSYKNLFCVLKQTGPKTKALIHLNRWCEKLERNGYLNIFEYPNKSQKGIERALCGTHSIGIRYKVKNERFLGISNLESNAKSYQL